MEVKKFIMKKLVLMLVLGIAIFVAGCGNGDTKAPHESQTMEDSNITRDTETEQNDILNYDDYMTSIIKQSDIIKASLEQESLTQMDMNLKSQELYELWDNALNYLWDELKDILPEEEFSKLLDEQQIWMAEKEKSVEEVGKEVEGGSIYSLVVNMEAAKIIEERVYELYELLK